MTEDNEEDKLEELRRVVTKVFSRNTIEWRTWTHYLRRQPDKEWKWNEGFNILLQVELFDVVIKSNAKFRKTAFDNFIKNVSTELPNNIQCTLVRLLDIWKERLRSGSNEWSQHYILCSLIDRLANCKQLQQQTVDCMLDYFLAILHCGHANMIVWTIDVIENVAMLAGGGTSDRVHTIRQKLLKLAEQMKRYDAYSLYESSCDWEAYQLAWCAKWSTENMVGVQKVVHSQPPVKISSDRFCARGGTILNTKSKQVNYSYHQVRSQFMITSGVYFYEAILITDRSMTFGWATRLSSSAIGHRNDLSIGYDTLQRGIWHGKECTQHSDCCHPHFIKDLPRGNPGDVVGCLIDVPNRRFEFYLNGNLIHYQLEHVHFSSQPYFATANLSRHQQCYFNFGQLPFKYPPNKMFSDFYSESGRDEMRFRLAETVVITVDRMTYQREWYWFKHEPIDNHVTVFFKDETQQIFDQLVKDVMIDIENGPDLEELKLENIEANANDRGLRFIQSVLEVWSHMAVSNEHVDIAASVIAEVIRTHIDRIQPHRFLELIYPYLYVKVGYIRRYMCIILSNVSKYCKRYYRDQYIKAIHDEIFFYLVQTLISIRDEWTELFAMVVFDGLNMCEEEKNEVRKIKKLSKLIQNKDRYSPQRNTFLYLHTRNLDKHNRRLKYQAFLCGHHLCTIVLMQPVKSDKELAESEWDMQTTLNPTDASPHAKVSPDNYSVRSDWEWESIRSACSANSYAIYYEVILLTSGPMCIGWATTRTELGFTKLGTDNFSIVYDGYTRSVWHDNQRHRVHGRVPRWKAGDVVGTLIDFSNRQFSFYLNGQLVVYQANVYFSDHAYHAAASVYAHQQCYFNFGQSPFMYLPKKTDFCDFVQYLKKMFAERLTRSKHTVHLSNVNNALININSRTTIKGDITMMQSHTEMVSSLTVTSGAISVNEMHEPRNCHLCGLIAPSQLLRFQCCPRLLFCHQCTPLINDCPIHKIM